MDLRILTSKHTLLQMAKSGEPRPVYSSRLGRRMSSYLSPTNASYDESFASQIRALSPNWCRDPQSDKSFDVPIERNSAYDIQSKSELRRMATGPRPYGRSDLGRMLKNYTDVYHINYDREFTISMRQLAPHWFPCRAKVTAA